MVLLIAVIVLLNISNTITLENKFISLKANVGFLILFCSLLGSISTIFLTISFGWFGVSDKERFKKQANSAKLNYEIESDKVKQLEAKVKTLEEALRMATKK